MPKKRLDATLSKIILIELSMEKLQCKEKVIEPLNFYKLSTKKYECKNKCLTFYVETIPRTMEREIKKMSLKQSKIEASDQDFVHTNLYTKEIAY